MPRTRIVYNVLTGTQQEIPYTAEEEEAADALAAAAQEVEANRPLTLHRIAATRLDVIEFEISGFERSEGVTGGWMNDIDWAVVMFAKEQPDTYYDVFPSDGVTKYTDRVEIQRTGLTTVNLLIQRVQ